MRRRSFLKDSVVVAAVLWLILPFLCETRAYGGWQLAVTFTTTSPGGDPRFEPRHVHAVWVENAVGAPVKTIGRWGVVEYRNLTQWMAADGTNIDGWTGATPQVYQQYRIAWDLTDRSGVQVPDGVYLLRFELTNNNASANQYHRTTVTFLKDGVPKSQFYASQDGYLNVTIDYTFTPTAVPQVISKPATYVTSGSARLGGQITNTGGEDPNVYFYWGDNDGGTDAGEWDHVMNLGRRATGDLHADVTSLDGATEYYYRLYAKNSAGGRWTDRTESFSTYGRAGSYTGYRVQSGRVKVEGPRLDIDILPVNDTRRAFALISYGTGWQPDADNADVVMARGYLLNAHTVRIERTSASNATWVSWQVIECLGQEFQVYRGTGSFGNSDSLVDAPLNGSPAQGGRRTSGPVVPDVSVNPARCIAYVTADSSSASRTYYHEALLTASVGTNTSVHIERAAAGHSAVNYNWVVVEFAPAAVASIQHGSRSFSSATQAAPASGEILSVNLGSSILIYQARSTVNGLCYSAVAGRLASSSTVEFYQYMGTSGTRYVEYYVIDFGSVASAQRGRIDFSNDTGWFRADGHLAPPVDVTRTMYCYGLSCNGSGDLYTRPFATAEFTSASNLRIERQAPGQQSTIEWQVLQLPPLTFFAQEPDIDLAPASLTGSKTATVRFTPTSAQSYN